jgi:hypothetical protein
LEQSLRQFETGTSPEARELAGQTAELESEYQQLEYVLQSRIKAVEGVLRQVEDLADYARNVTFYRYVRPISETPIVPPEFQDAHLPQLDEVVQEAGQNAKKRYSQVAKKTSDQAPSKLRRAPQSDKSAPSSLRTVAVEIPDSPPKLAPTGATHGRHSAPVATPVAQPRAAGQKQLPQDSRPSKEKIDGTNAGKLGPSLPGGKADEPRHLRIMEATIQLAFLAARVDGSVKPNANELIERHIRQRYAYESSLFNHAKGFCAHYQTAAIDRERCFRTIIELCTPDHRASLLIFLEDIMKACGPLNSSTQQCLKAWRGYLGVPEPTSPAAPAPKPPSQQTPALPANARIADGGQPPTKDADKYRPEPPKAREERRRSPVQAEREHRSVLENEHYYPLSADLVRRQYRLLQERFAPEKVHAMGADVIATVKKKRDAIRVAAAALLEKMGEKLADETRSVPADLRANPDLDDVFGA